MQLAEKRGLVVEKQVQLADKLGLLVEKQVALCSGTNVFVLPCARQPPSSTSVMFLSVLSCISLVGTPKGKAFAGGHDDFSLVSLSAY